MALPPHVNHFDARLCVCEREPCAHFAYLVPERIERRAASMLYFERASRAAGVSLQHELQVLTLPSLWARRSQRTTK